ncbi:hypothetical protein Zmor_028199 [Zophobas morio]|uniref:Uncharacterized protein n=1 Tax=Zophobas morio TaxID=2755281 RepID=A0AA38HSA5_9CUCU|nr:hypothetical protein Zmor_028199 [Zophobas morio]
MEATAGSGLWSAREIGAQVLPRRTGIGGLLWRRRIWDGRHQRQCRCGTDTNHIFTKTVSGNAKLHGRNAKFRENEHDCVARWNYEMTVKFLLQEVKFARA